MLHNHEYVLRDTEGTMKVILMADSDNRHSVGQDLEQLDRDSQAGWNRFTRFLLVNLIATVVALLVIAAFTVWS